MTLLKFIHKSPKDKETDIPSRDSVDDSFSPLRLRGGCFTDSAFEIDKDRKYGEYGKTIRGRNTDNNKKSYRGGGKSGRRVGASVGATSSGGGGGGGH